MTEPVDLDALAREAHAVMDQAGDSDQAPWATLVLALIQRVREAELDALQQIKDQREEIACLTAERDEWRDGSEHD